MNDTPINEAEVKELQGRTEEFNKELIPLLGKYELGLGASAFVNPNGTIGSRPILFDARKKVDEAAAPTTAPEATPEAATPASDAGIVEG